VVDASRYKLASNARKVRNSHDRSLFPAPADFHQLDSESDLMNNG
jgi:hypothetical protein